MSESDPAKAAAPAGASFPTTRWSVVRAAGDPDVVVRSLAMERLIAAYWRPVYKHLRWKWRLSAPDAEDVTQDFFARALERDTFARYDPAKARFRTFVRLCTDRFVANQLQAAKRQKRGGGAPVLGLDFAGAESEIAIQPVSAEPDAEASFRREWTRSLFMLAVDDLRGLCEAGGKAIHFALFERYDLERTEDGPDYAQLAAEFSLPATQVTNYLAWTRRELRRLVLERLRELTATAAEYRAEARDLLGFDPDESA